MEEEGGRGVEEEGGRGVVEEGNRRKVGRWKLPEGRGEMERDAAGIGTHNLPIFLFSLTLFQHILIHSCIIIDDLVTYKNHMVQYCGLTEGAYCRSSFPNILKTAKGNG